MASRSCSPTCVPAARLPLDGDGRRARKLVGGHRTQPEARSLKSAGLHTSGKLLTLLNPGALTCWRKCSTRSQGSGEEVRKLRRLSAQCLVPGEVYLAVSIPMCPLPRSAPPEPPPGSREHSDAWVGSNGLEHLAYLIQAGDET